MDNNNITITADLKTLIDFIIILLLICISIFCYVWGKLLLTIILFILTILHSFYSIRYIVKKNTEKIWTDRIQK